jgi:hypothetical protein
MRRHTAECAERGGRTAEYPSEGPMEAIELPAPSAATGDFRRWPTSAWHAVPVHDRLVTSTAKRILRRMPRLQLGPVHAASVAAIVAILTTGCSSTDLFSDDETPEPTTPAAPRNQCERVFFDEMVAGYPQLPTELHAPTPEAVEAVFATCTEAEVIAANERFPVTVGRGPMTYLSGRVLFGTGPESPASQLRRMCDQSELTDLTACHS